MRGFLRTALPVLGTVMAIFVGSSVVGQAAAAERRVIATPDSDYSGFDYKTLKSVTLDACKKACVDDQTCRAFTYNTKASWCFLKNDNGPLASAPGATAGRVVDAVVFT